MPDQFSSRLISAGGIYCYEKEVCSEGHADYWNRQVENFHLVLGEKLKSPGLNIAFPYTCTVAAFVVADLFLLVRFHPLLYAGLR